VLAALRLARAFLAPCVTCLLAVACHGSARMPITGEPEAEPSGEPATPAAAARPPDEDAGADLAVQAKAEVFWAPVGARLALVRRGAVLLIDPARAREARALAPRANAVTQVVWADDAALLATSTEHGDLEVHRADGTRLFVAATPVDRLHAAAFSHDSSLLAADWEDAQQRRKFAVWDLTAAAPLPTTSPEPTAGGYWQLAFLPDDQRLAGFDPVAVTVWEARTGKVTGGREFDTGATSPIALSRDGRFAAVSLSQHALVAWPLGGGREYHLDAAAGCADHLEGLRFSPDGRVLTMSSASGRVAAWSLPSLSARSRWKPARADHVVGSLSDDGSLVVRVRADGRADVVDVFTGRSLRALEGPLPRDADLLFSGDGRWVAHGGATPAVWEIATGRRTLL
jgi:WD40 repeat protein